MHFIFLCGFFNTHAHAFYHNAMLDVGTTEIGSSHLATRAGEWSSCQIFEKDLTSRGALFIWRGHLVTRGDRVKVKEIQQPNINNSGKGCFGRGKVLTKRKMIRRSDSPQEQTTSYITDSRTVLN